MFFWEEGHKGYDEGSKDTKLCALCATLRVLCAKKLMPGLTQEIKTNR
jgi:hypothetical protein